MWLNNMTDQQKARAFDLICEQTKISPNALQFTSNVCKILKQCIKLFE